MLLNRLLGRGHPILIVACLFGINLSYAAAQNHTPGTAQLAGWVYIDRNNDGILAFANDPHPEYVIPGVSIDLYALNGQQETYIDTKVTDDYGRYFFNNLAPGTYALKQLQPVEFVDGLDTLGKLMPLTNQPIPPNASPGIMLNNIFTNIVLTANIRGDYYNFGELGMAPGYVSKRYLLGSAPDMNFAVPEPSTLLLAGSAMVTAMLPRRRRAD